MSVERFGRCVREGDATTLIRLPGVGKKTAERIIVDLRDKVGIPSKYGAPDTPTITTTNEPDEALDALIALGFPLKEATTALEKIDRSLPVSERVRQALRS